MASQSAEGRGRGRWLARVLAAAILLAAEAPVVAQSFAEAYAAAERLRSHDDAEPAQVEAAYRAAFERFLANPLRGATRRSWLPSAAFCAFHAAAWSDAADLFEESIALGNRDAFHVGFLVRSRQRARRADQALLAAREYESEFPAAIRQVLIDERGLWTGGALAASDRALRRGDTELGLWAFRYAVRVRGADPLDLANLALALRHIGAEAESEAAYRQALDKDADNQGIWNDFGLFLKGTGRGGEAEAAFSRSRACEATPATGPATTNLAALALRDGRAALAQPARAMAEVLRARPAAGLARRVYLETLRHRPRPRQK